MRIPAFLFVVLMGADLLTTFIGLHHGAMESNPLWPTHLMVPAKIVATIFILVGFHILTTTFKKSLQYTRAYFWCVNLLMFAVVINNAIVIALQTG